MEKSIALLLLVVLVVAGYVYFQVYSSKSVQQVSIKSLSANALTQLSQTYTKMAAINQGISTSMRVLAPMAASSKNANVILLASGMTKIYWGNTINSTISGMNGMVSNKDENLDESCLSVQVESNSEQLLSSQLAQQANQINNSSIANVAMTLGTEFKQLNSNSTECIDEINDDLQVDVNQLDSGFVSNVEMTDENESIVSPNALRQLDDHNHQDEISAAPDDNNP